jgi:hypothetical protein
MTTATETPAATVGHRIAWITGALTVALAAAGILNDYLGPMDVAPGLVAHFAALCAAVATALLSGNRFLTRTAWVLAPLCWLLALYAWFGYLWEGSELPWADYVVTPIFLALMAAPPLLLLLTVRRPTGPGAFAAEAGALIIIALSLFVLTLYISTQAEPGSPAGWLALLYTGAAGLLVFTAWRRPDRRVAYGFVVLLLVALAAGSPWLFYSADPEETPVGFIGIDVFAPVALILVPAVAATLQVAWNARRKAALRAR